MDNRRTKVLLIKHFGGTVSFTYPENRRTSQMVYSSSLNSNRIIESAPHRIRNSFKMIANDLLNECKEYNFQLDYTYCTSDDLAISMSNYTRNRPKKWLEFMKLMFPNTSNTNTNEWLLKFDTLFQFMHYWLTKGNKTPLHCTLAQSIHNLTGQRNPIDICNRLNFSISYDTMKRLTTAYAEKFCGRYKI